MTPERWREAFARLHQARALDPLNAKYAAELGRHHAWLAWRSLSVADASRAYRRNSQEAFSQAISLRPSWGYAWANFAEARLLQGLTDERTVAALDRAMTLSPWEPKTHQKSLLLAFALWDALDQEQRQMAGNTLQRALLAGVELDLIFRMAVQAGQQKLVKEMLTQSHHRRRLDELIAQSER